MMDEGKKQEPALDAARPAEISVGEILHAARIKKKLEFEDVSSSIHIRPVQLRAIEDNDIDALPGMTYAVGFVRSYAIFLGLDGAEIVQKFKAEHRDAETVKLSFPEPEAESRMPDLMTVGVAVFLAVLVLVLWTVYSNVQDGDEKLAEQISSPPVVTTTSGTTTISAVTATSDISVEPKIVDVVSVPPASAVFVPSPSPVVVEKQPVVKKTERAKPLSKPPVAVTKRTKPKVSSVINIKRGTSRIVLRAVQASWIQITNAKRKVLFMKVLRPGEQYFVPNQSGLSMVTANAGGLEIEVDGQIVQEVGKPGEIVRGIVLDPKSLKKRRVRVRN